MPNLRHLRISIHALRVEGDAARASCISQNSKNFYPRPPGGGRHGEINIRRRANNFYPRPPGGGRPDAVGIIRGQTRFLSTPSGWRATFLDTYERPAYPISIHALRVEGDASFIFAKGALLSISIHALRVEGDACLKASTDSIFSNFYPRPPGGGRP